MFTEIEVANQLHCRAHYNLCLPYTEEHVLFVCDKACEQLTQERIENGKRTIEICTFLSQSVKLSIEIRI